MLTESVEMYLLTIYRLTENAPRAKTSQIAAVMDVRMSSVSEMLTRLNEAGYVIHEGYKGAKLTPSGQGIALDRLRKHRLLETFLAQMAGYAIDEVHEEACRLEHVISDRLADSLEKLLGYPPVDPHGHPIPAADGLVTAVTNQPLSAARVGQTAVIRRVEDQNGEKLRYLRITGLVPGVWVKVLEKAPLQGPITISFHNKTTSIAYDVAQEIGVEIGQQGVQA